MTLTFEYGPMHEISVLIASSSNEVLDESAHMHRLTRAFNACIYKKGCGINLKPKFRRLVPLDTSARVIKEAFCAYVVRTKISCARQSDVSICFLTHQ